MSVIANLWNVNPTDEFCGSATSGSSEAIFLGIQALKKHWQARLSPDGAEARYAPNIVVGSHLHISIQKSAAACDVELRKVPVKPEDGYVLDIDYIRSYLDAGTSELDRFRFFFFFIL